MALLVNNKLPKLFIFLYAFFACLTVYITDALQWAKASLIPATAFPGFRCFGHVLVQFMIVWHRYSLNGSSRLARRFAVCPSRLSEIQRKACMRTAGPR